MCTCPLFHTYNMSPAFRTFLFDDPNSVWRRVSLSLMCSPPVFCYRVHLRPERLPKDTVLNTESHTNKKQRAKLY
jgi:hypothetical protein